MTEHNDNSPESTSESLLRSYISAPDAESAQGFLDDLIAKHVHPQVCRAVNHKLLSFGPSRGNLADQQDLCQDVVLRLLRRFQDVRANQGLSPITNLPGYITATVHNACHKQLREKYPARWRFKNRLRYVITHTPRFEMWCDQQEQTLCGLAAWPPSRNLSDSGVSPPDLEEFSVRRVPRSDSPEDLIALTEEFLKWYGRPVPLDDMVGVLADICGVREAKFVEQNCEADVALSELLRDPSPSPEQRLASKMYLQRLWNEIGELPLNQRMALLLNMKDSGGAEALILFTQTGIVTIRQIADILNIQYDSFVELWNELPLDDNAIASRQGLTRQRVINLRKSARERLARRMQDRRGPDEKSATAS